MTRRNELDRFSLTSSFQTFPSKVPGFSQAVWRKANRFELSPGRLAPKLPGGGAPHACAGRQAFSPGDFEELLLKTRDLPDASWEFVKQATLSAPSEITDANDQIQLNHQRQLAGEHTASVREKRLGFIISLKHPHPWVVSLAKYNARNVQHEGRLQMNPGCVNLLEEACRNYNLRHRAWLDLHLANPGRSFLVHYERLLKNPNQELLNLEKFFRLRRRYWKLKLPKQSVAPTHWDQHSPNLEQEKFNSTFYRKQQYLDR
jgi:hypothetical protein